MSNNGKAKNGNVAVPAATSQKVKIEPLKEGWIAVNASKGIDKSTLASLKLEYDQAIASDKHHEVSDLDEPRTCMPILC